MCTHTVKNRSTVFDFSTHLVSVYHISLSFTTFSEFSIFIHSFKMTFQICQIYTIRQKLEKLRNKILLGRIFDKKHRNLFNKIDTWESKEDRKEDKSGIMEKME